MEDIDGDSADSDDEPVLKKSREEEISDLLFTKPAKPERKTTQSLIKSEMNYFEVTGDLPPMLTQLKCAISSIPATSVEVERLFSAAGCFVTKLKTRLQDNMVDTLCVLRSYFLKTRK